MKRLQKYIVIFGTAMLCVGFSACSKQSNFDVQSYVKSSLDAEYHREYADHANLMEISEEDVKKQVEENFNESIRQQFASSDNITEEEIAAYTEKMAEVKKLAKYKLQDEKKDEDGNYTVSVKVEPSDVFQTLQQSSAEVSKEKIAQGMKKTDPGVFASVLTESVQKSIDKNSCEQLMKKYIWLLFCSIITMLVSGYVYINHYFSFIMLIGVTCSIGSTIELISLIITTHKGNKEE